MAVRYSLFFCVATFVQFGCPSSAIWIVAGSLRYSEEAKAAIEALNGSELDSRTLVVNEARPKS